MKLSRAAKRGRQLRHQYQLTGMVDVDGLTRKLNLKVVPWRFPTVDEVKVGNIVAIKAGLPELKRRWAIAHAIGHNELHPGNYLWLRTKTRLAVADERQAEDFAYGLLVDEEEAERRGIFGPWGMAFIFGVPQEMVEQRWV